MFEANGTTAVSPLLDAGSDFDVTFAGDPDCTVTISILSAAGAIGTDQRLIVTYQSLLDLDSQQDAQLTNIAGATEWFSRDVSDAAQANYARTYTRVLTDGTVVVHSDGSESKPFAIRDGIALVWAQRAGIKVGILSARNSPTTPHRAAQLGITLIYQGVKSKADA